MTSDRKLLRYALPAGLTIFCWLTMRTVASFSDESMTSYGFPFPWYSPDTISSMAYVIAIIPFLIDLTIYVSASFVAISFLLQRSEGRYLRLVSIALWLMACASLTLKISIILISPQIVAWTLDSYYFGKAQRSYGVQLGLGR